jgi:hypothetical protein
MSKIEQDGDHDEACLHPVPPLSPSPIVHVPSFRLLSSLESFVAVALKLVHLLETVLPLVIDPWNLTLKHDVPPRRHL